MYSKRRVLTLSLVLAILLGLMNPIISMAAKDKEVIHLTILGTTDMHANLYNWSYEDNKELDDRGIALVASVVDHYRAKNPNTILIDNGDTIQGTILSDDLYNVDLHKKNPIIEAMNSMGYDSMTLGNHEFNFGLDLIEKIEKEANFPILAANVSYKDGKDLVKPYTIVEVAGLKVGIIGVTNPQIRRWDASKVEDLDFFNMADSYGKYIEEVKEKSDLVIGTAHAGLDVDHGDDGAREIAERFPELKALLVGHSHATVEEEVNGVVVGGARDAGKEVVVFDLELLPTKEGYDLINKSVKVVKVEDFEPSKDLQKVAEKAHKSTLDFISEVIGKASADFQPENEIKGIPEAQLRDTALIDLINNIQLKEAKADVSAAALFQSGARIKKGDINYADIFNVYKFPNTIYGVEINGKELKDYMEWSVDFYNTWKPGDINISFNEDVRGYRYDMFQGVDYKIDLSKEVGERIVDLKFKGKAVQATDKFKLAVNNFRYDNIVSEGLIGADNEVYFKSDPKALRSYIADYIREKGLIEPEVDNNWEIVGIDLNHPARDFIVDEINAGRMELPKSEDGRSYNIAGINAPELIKRGEIPADYQRPTSDVKIKVNKKLMTIPEDSGRVFIKAGRTMIPLRAVSENLGHKVTWDKVDRTITIDEAIALTIGQKKISVKGVEKEMDASAFIEESRTYVPLKFISEALGYKVEWDSTTRTVNISK